MPLLDFAVEFRIVTLYAQGKEMKNTKQTVYILEVYAERIEFATLNELYHYMDRADFGLGEIYMKNGDSIVNIHSDK